MAAGGGVALHEGGRDEDGLGFGGGVAFADEAEEMDGGDAAHVIEGLAHGGEAGANGGGGGDIVKADDGDIAWNVEAGLVQRGDGAHGGDVIEGKDGGEGFAAREEGLGGLVAWFGSGLNALELHDELGFDGDVEFGADFANGIPAGGGV